MKYEVKTEIDSKELKGRRLKFDWGYQTKEWTGTIIDVILAGYRPSPNQLKNFYNNKWPAGADRAITVDRVLVEYFDSEDEEKHKIVIPLNRGGRLHWNLV